MSEHATTARRAHHIGTLLVSLATVTGPAPTTMLKPAFWDALARITVECVDLAEALAACHEVRSCAVAVLERPDDGDAALRLDLALLGLAIELKGASNDS